MATPQFLPDHVERALRRAFPTGRIEDAALPPIDEVEEERKFRPLLRSMDSPAIMRVDAELGADGAWKTNKVYVGKMGSPSWAEFNRDFPDHRRMRELQGRKAGLTYWIIVLSRLVPFWTGSSWNRFELRTGQVWPVLTSTPQDERWLEIIATTRSVLSAAGYQEISPELLNVRLPWLSSSYSGSMRPRNLPADGITVEEALFREIE